MSKRLLASNILMRITEYLNIRTVRSNALYIFNYHRLKPSEGLPQTNFDIGVFGPDVKQFRQQMVFLKQHTTVLSETEFIDLLDHGHQASGPYSIVTFDDAYIDTYTLALPILSELEIPAILFVPAVLIEERELGWWDKIAFIINNSRKKSILLRGRKIRIGDNKTSGIRAILKIMQFNCHDKTANLVPELAEAADSSPPSRDLMDRELMTWDHLERAYASGVALGSHTCRHWVLSTLNEEQQAREIGDSKRIIEKRLGHRIRSLAYPVGGLKHFNDTSMRLAASAGYDVAFSYGTGIARIGDINRYAIPRLGAPEDSNTLKALFHFPRMMDYNSKARNGNGKQESDYHL